MTTGRKDYTENKTKRIENLKKASTKAAQEAEKQDSKANIKKSIEAREKAKQYAQKAKAAENNNAIDSDNPDALQLLKRKLAAEENSRERMKKINEAYQKGKQAMLDIGISEDEYERIEAKIKIALPWEKQPFPKWKLDNLGQNIRRIKARIESLELLSTIEAIETAFEGGRLLDNVEENRVQFIFDYKPCEEIRRCLKSYAYRWAPSKGAWQKKRSLDTIEQAQQIVEQLQEAGLI